MKKNLQRAGAVLIALALWHLIAITIDSPIVLVTPVRTARRLLTIWREETFFPSVCFTLLRVLLGYVLGALAGFFLAVPSSSHEWIETLVWPFVISARSVPVASLVVLCLIWLSSRNLSVLIVFLVVFPLMYQNILSGLKVRQTGLEEMADVFRMSGWRRFRYIRLPALSPHLLSACKTTAGMAWKAAAAAEVIGTPPGSIGRQLYLAKTYLATEDLLCWTIVIIIMGTITEKAVVFCLRMILIRMGCLATSRLS